MTEKCQSEAKARLAVIISGLRNAPGGSGTSPGLSPTLSTNKIEFKAPGKPRRDFRGRGSADQCDPPFPSTSAAKSTIEL